MLHIYPDANSEAQGFLYEDDGFTLDYQNGAYSLYSFRYSIIDGEDNLEIKQLKSNYKKQEIKFIAKIVTSEKQIEFEVKEKVQNFKFSS